MAKKDPKDPSTTSYAYDRMVDVWKKLDTLIEGTDAMRAAGQEYLPQHEEEGDVAYNERLSKATLLNVTKMTLESWVGKPFSDPLQVGADVPEEIKSILPNIDLQGNSLDVFSRHWFREGVAKGLSHVLVDFPRPRPTVDGRPRTLADDRAENLRPYLCQIRPENLIFAHSEMIDGVETVTHVRILEEHIQMVGFGEVCVLQIRQITPGKVVIYEQHKDPRTKKIVWVQIDTYDYDLNFVPLVTFYTDREEFMVSRAPLNDLADLNIRHWQSTSDQISILTVARFPILAVSGAIADQQLTIGPNQWLNCPDAAGRFYYVEHAGKAIAAGRADLLDLEETMAEYGATFLKKRPGGASATARALDTAEVTSPLQDMAIRFNAALQQAVLYLAKWLKMDSAGTFGVNLDFGMSEGDQVKLDALTEARQGKDISRVKYLEELKRFAVLSEEFDVAKNETELGSEKDYQALSDIKVAKAAPKITAPGPVKPAKKAPAAKIKKAI